MVRLDFSRRLSHHLFLYLGLRPASRSAVEGSAIQMFLDNTNQQISVTIEEKTLQAFEGHVYIILHDKQYPNIDFDVM